MVGSNTGQREMSAKILIAYYSRTGHTRKVAERLARRLDARLCPIRPIDSREGPVGYLRSLVEAVCGVEPQIRLPACEPTQADLVLLGTPVWGWRLSSPMRSLARRWRKDIRACAFFCTMGGSGSDRAFRDLRQLVGRTPVATLALSEGEVAKVSAQRKIDGFVAAVRRNVRGGDRSFGAEEQRRAA
jgi:flavodoxin